MLDSSVAGTHVKLDISASCMAGMAGMAQARILPGGDLIATDVFQRGGITIVADARLDNRAELAAALTPDLHEELVSDIELILLAYLKWGSNSPRYILGDFSYALWDQRDESLFCVRDHLGIKPLFYTRSKSGFIFSNSIAPILQNPQVDKGFSDEAVAIYLSRGELYHRELTFYREIRKLPPGMSVRVSVSGIHFEQYWDLERRDLHSVVINQDPSRQLRSLLSDAVEKRMRSDHGVGCHLSGGLDSSAIVAFAQKSSANAGKITRAYNWVPQPRNDKDASAPEWSAARLMAQREGITLSHTDFDDLRMLELLENHNIAKGDSVNLWYEHFVTREAAREGVDVMLSGWGGDQLVSNYGVARYADSFWHGQPLATLSELWRCSATAGRPWRRFLGTVASQLVIRPVAVLYQQLSGKNLSQKYDLLQCCKREFRQYAQSKKPRPTWLNPFSVRSALLWEHKLGHLLNRVESWAVGGAEVGIEYRYPLLDKRVVEFALAVPAEQYRRNGIGRYMFRETVAPMLPEAISWGNLKEEPVRVDEFNKAQLAAIIKWKTIHEAESWQSDYIDVKLLYALIETLQGDEIEDDLEKLVAVRTALQSIFILNMEINGPPSGNGSLNSRERVS